MAQGCGGTCGQRHGGYCSRRVAERPDTDETKSRAGKRSIGLPDQLVALLRAHAAEQAREREAAGSLWQDDGWHFAGLVGQLLNPRTDYSEWKRLLTAAGVRDGRLHDARHTAATVLLILGVPERAVMSLMGSSNTAMASKYQHLTASIRRDVATQVDGLLWGLPTTGPASPVDTDK